VAKLAGASVSTVSLALNNKKKVSGATRKKVIEAARKLSYYSSSIARRFALNKTRTFLVFQQMIGTLTDQSILLNPTE